MYRDVLVQTNMYSPFVNPQIGHTFRIKLDYDVYNQGGYQVFENSFDYQHSCTFWRKLSSSPPKWEYTGRTGGGVGF